MLSFSDYFGGVLLVCGTAFLLLGGLGLLRMPDIFNRIQAGTKTTTLGTILTLSGAAFLHPEWGFKLLLIGLFLLFTNPLSSQVLSRAAHRGGTFKSEKTIVDKLADDLAKNKLDSNLDKDIEATQQTEKIEKTIHQELK